MDRRSEVKPAGVARTAPDIITGESIEFVQELADAMQADKKAWDDLRWKLAMLLVRVRDNLKRWNARYAGSDHAKRQVAETKTIIAEVEALYDELPHHCKD